MENKIEYKILDDKIIVYFYGELSSSNVSKYRNLINNILEDVYKRQHLSFISIFSLSIHFSPYIK